jgi:arsenate reductase (thioredoxin)
MASGEKTTGKLRVLVLCTGNSARSQMAEGWLRRLGDGRVEAFSAGTKPASAVNPLAVRVMGEVGIDLSGQRPKSVEGFLGQPLDYVITVCDDAAEACPVFPGPVQRIHWSFQDPAKVEGDEQARLAAFRQVRDGLRDRLQSFLSEALVGQATACR